jgi:NADH:ubiquinone oxidoreductase subunit K
VARTWNLFSNRNALEFVAEVYVVHQVHTYIFLFLMLLVLACEALLSYLCPIL